LNTAAILDNLLSIVDDAVSIAKEAVAIAEQPANAPAAAVTLTKVARSRYSEVADALLKSGMFSGHTHDSLVKTLEESGEPGQLNLLEKLASSAVFPIASFNELSGDLVEKAGKNDSRYEGLNPKQALWRRAMDEAEEELG
jgi:hypothetical protein